MPNQGRLRISLHQEFSFKMMGLQYLTQLGVGQNSGKFGQERGARMEGQVAVAGALKNPSWWAVPEKPRDHAIGVRYDAHEWLRAAPNSVNGFLNEALYLSGG